MLFLALAAAGAATATITARLILIVRFFCCSYASDHHCRHDDVKTATVMISVPCFPDAIMQNGPLWRFGVFASSCEGEIWFSSQRTLHSFGFNRSFCPKPFSPNSSARISGDAPRPQAGVLRFGATSGRIVLETLSLSALD